MEVKLVHNEHSGRAFDDGLRARGREVSLGRGATCTRLTAVPNGARHAEGGFHAKAALWAAFALLVAEFSTTRVISLATSILLHVILEGLNAQVVERAGAEDACAPFHATRQRVELRGGRFSSKGRNV